VRARRVLCVLGLVFVVSAFARPQAGALERPFGAPFRRRNPQTRNSVGPVWRVVRPGRNQV
jgi:hypothetical protein